MTPNDLEAYLVVLARNQVGAAALKLPGGIEVNVSFVPQLPPYKPGDEITPGGWKGLPHLDDPAALRDDGEYKGGLPS